MLIVWGLFYPYIEGGGITGGGVEDPITLNPKPTP